METKPPITWGQAHPNGTPKASRETAWDGPREVAAAGVPDLLIMCAWREDKPRDELNKGDFKLPHHRASDHAVVWRGVVAAMARLLQAGTDIPDRDRRGVYNHLARHYRDDFDTEPPEFRSAGSEQVVFEVDDMQEAAEETPAVIRRSGYEGLHDVLSEVRADLATFILASRARFDVLEERLLEIANAQVKLVSRDRLDDQIRSLGKAADQRTKDAREEFAGAFGRLTADVKAVAEEARGLRSGIELNVERKLLDFETAVAAKVEAALDVHLTEARVASEAGGAALLQEIEAQVGRALGAALDRFRDFYSGRLADYEARDEQRADRIGDRLQSVQQLLLRAVSKLDQALSADQTSDGLRGMNDVLCLHGEVLRELVDVLAKMSQGDDTIEDGIMIEQDGDGEADVVELDVGDGELAADVASTVKASFKRLMSDEVHRRFNQIRGRLD